MKALVVDDKYFAVDDLIATLEDIDPQGEYIGKYSPAEALVAVEETSDFDVVFLDIDMPGENGMELAKKMMKIRKKLNIIFVTGYPEYALPVHEMYVSGFLVKPASKTAVQKALENLRYPINQKRIRIHALGNFEVFVDEKPLKFGRTKTKELLAYLVDRHGAGCTNGELMAILWEDDGDIELRSAHLRKLIKDLKDTFEKEGLEEFVVRGRNTTSILTDMVSCDYYDLLAAGREAVDEYTGEYMMQYSWAETTMRDI